MEHISHIAEFFTGLFSLDYLPTLGDKVGLGLIFVFGVLTSFHCIGMCGGLILSNNIEQRGVSPILVYNMGRVASYTAVGGIAGNIGHAVNLTGVWKGIIPILGGTFMILLAVKYLNVFPVLRKLNIMLPSFIARRIFAGKYKSNLIIGLLSGLMPCGPLQMIQLYALGTKSGPVGAVSAFIFALGTIPILFTFGLINLTLLKKHARLVASLSAGIVIVMGFAMLGRGLALAGVDTGLPIFDSTGYKASEVNRNVRSEIAQKLAQKTDPLNNQDDRSELNSSIQIIDTELKAYEYPAIIVKKGIPVRWNLKADKENLNDCNNEIIIPDLNIEKKLQPGDNIIEFTPSETGELVYTCWMGMIKSKIKVID